MARTPLVTERLPAPVLPYSTAVSGAARLWLSGIVGNRPGTPDLAGETAADQLVQVLANLDAVLAGAGKSEADVLKVTLYLTDMSEFAAVNDVYAQYFTKPYPARTAIAVAALPIGARIEADVVVG
ncbi:endoribonuclease L-PSP [Actinomadura madurae]|uniref:Endoribonuclease L-PSP n=1 Tax=Actinomadura madurae TaxID=1993 RepID=A0A1I5I772_9ACTN|nr:Rid family detoxifying hydrolase [Actinomadura madurae]SFO55901.1 endoribonuclease L-PSP [Actinomadura madurae]